MAEKSIEDLIEIRIDPDRFFLLGSQLLEPEKTNPKHKPVIQKACRTGIPQTEAVIEEVQKLLEA